MSTTPMHRPFLVGQRLAALNSIGPRLVSSDATHGLAGRDLVYRGLHLVPVIPRKTVGFAGPFQNSYKIAAVAAALFLVLTVV